MTRCLVQALLAHRRKGEQNGLGLLDTGKGVKATYKRRELLAKYIPALSHFKSAAAYIQGGLRRGERQCCACLLAGQSAPGGREEQSVADSHWPRPPGERDAFV